MPAIQRYAPDVVLEAGRRGLTEEEYRHKVYQTYGVFGALAYMREGKLSYETQQRLWQEQQRRKETQMRRDYQQYRLLGALTMMRQEAPLTTQQKEAISQYYTEQKAFQQRIAAGEFLLGSKIQQIAYKAGGEPGREIFTGLKPQEYYEISEWQVIWGAKLGEKLSKPQIVTAPKEPTVKPPKDWGEWLGRGWEGLVGFSQKRVKEAYEPRFAEAVLYGPKLESRTQRAIAQIESFQQWIRIAPAPEVMMLKEGRIVYGKPTERYAEALEYAYIPVGAVRAVEASSYLVAVPFAFAKGEVTPENIAKGVRDWVSNVQKQPIMLITTYEPEVALKHKGLVIGELAGQYFMGRYVYGPAIGKAWQKMKGGAQWVYQKTPLYEKALYKKVTALPKVPIEEPFKVLTKTKMGLEYKPLRIAEETAKKTQWKPTVITKPKGFKPIQRAWYPPEPMKSTALRELVVSSNKGMALITKQVTTQVTKQVSKTMTAPKLASLSIVTASLLGQTVPSLVKYKGPQYPSKYKQKKEVTMLLFPKLAPYPEVKPKMKTKSMPASLLKPFELKGLKQPQPQIPKEFAGQPQSIQQIQSQIQQQMQKQTQTFPPQYQLSLEKKRVGKRKDLFAKWFKKQQKIKTPKQMLKTYFGGGAVKKIQEIF